MKSCLIIIIALLLIPCSAFASDEWYSEWIELFHELEYVEHIEEVEPNSTMNKIDFLKLVLKYLNYEDVEVLEKSVELGLISNHKTDSIFSNPDSPIAREEAARVVYNAFTKSNSMYSSDIAETVSSQIKDMDKINVINKSGVIGSLYEGLLTQYPDKTFNPKRELTQAEIAVVLCKLTLAEQRKHMDLDLPVFIYHGNESKNDFKVYYSNVHQDIYNVLKLMSEFESHNISNLTPMNTHLAKGYQEDLHITVEVSKSNIEYPIKIKHNKASMFFNEDVYKLYFYLFLEDANRIIEKVKAYSDDELKETQSIEYETETINRKVTIVVDSENVELKVTKVYDASQLNNKP